jgi:hypothetical protein
MKMHIKHYQHIEKQQDLLVERGQNLLIKLYKHKKTIDQKSFFLLYNILQHILYKMAQQCCISLEIANHCFNDGANATPISLASFEKCLYHSPKKALINPITTEKVTDEFILYYNNLKNRKHYIIINHSNRNIKTDFWEAHDEAFMIIDRVITANSYQQKDSVLQNISKIIDENDDKYKQLSWFLQLKVHILKFIAYCKYTLIKLISVPGSILEDEYLNQEYIDIDRAVYSESFREYVETSLKGLSNETTKIE